MEFLTKKPDQLNRWCHRVVSLLKHRDRTPFEGAFKRVQMCADSSIINALHKINVYLIINLISTKGDLLIRGILNNVVRKMEQNGTAVRHCLPSPAQFILEEFMQFLIKSINNLLKDLNNIALYISTLFFIKLILQIISNYIKLLEFSYSDTFRFTLHFPFRVQQRVKSHIVA